MLNSTKGHDGSEYDILNDKKPHWPERGKIYKHFLVPSCYVYSNSWVVYPELYIKEPAVCQIPDPTIVPGQVENVSERLDLKKTGSPTIREIPLTSPISLCKPTSSSPTTCCPPTWVPPLHNVHITLHIEQCAHQHNALPCTLNIHNTRWLNSASASQRAI